jgi:hypothetical protein
MNFVVKAHSPADILAMVPSLVGFAPRNSLVLIAFRGRRTCGAIRFTLPKAKTEVARKRFATFALGTLCKLRQVDAVIPVIRTDALFGARSAPPEAGLANVLARRIQQSGFELRELLCHAGDGWASYLDPESPAGGHPLTQIAESAVIGDLPIEFRGTPDGTDPPARVPDAAEPERERVRRALASYRALAVSSGSGDVADAAAHPIEFEPLDDLPLFVELALYWDDDAITQNDALLLFVVQGPPVRDLAMLQWAFHISVGDRFLEETERANGHLVDSDPDASREAWAVIGDLMLGIGPRPDPERIERGISLLLTVIARADDAERPAPLCMLAWLSWALGHGTDAGRYVAEARSIDPDYSMAVLLHTIFSSGRLPEWAFVDG